jgi:tetratricopeptide (TPR) repeat protein
VEQPTGIDLAQYLEAWPGLEPAVVQLRTGARDAARADLRRVSAAASSDGALNLLAQLEREDGKLDDSEALIGKAIASNPTQHLHRFQQAMIFFVHLSQASGAMSRWSWHRKTRDAYQRAFDLDPRPVPYRYYLVYTFLQSPGIAGGDKNKALRMAQEGVDRGQKEFYVVRADVHRLRGEQAPAFSDYDRAIAERTFKLNSFLAAGQLALEKREQDRARRYFEWAVTCRPDSARTHEGLGDYYAALGDARSAATAYEAALRADPHHAPAREKAAKLNDVR